MVTVFRHSPDLTGDSFFDGAGGWAPPALCHTAIEMLQSGSDVVDVGPAASHPDAGTCIAGR